MVDETKAPYTTDVALRELYVAEGGAFEDVESLTTTPELIGALAALKAGATTDETPVEDTTSANDDETQNFDDEGATNAY